MPVKRLPPTDVVIELDNVDELFSVDPRDLLSGAHRIDSGMDELVERFLAQKTITAEQRIVLNIANECSDEVAATVTLAVRRYLQLRMRRAIREHNLIWRQGKRSLFSGSLLFIIGVSLSYAFTRPIMGEVVEGLLGNGVFLVVAWVGLWYPLDLLFIAREQAKREIRVLGKMLDVPVVIRASDRTMPIPVTPHPPFNQALPLSLNARFRKFRGPSKSGL
ncbi:hypothetical protein [Mycolicibacterium sphagni]|uniref:Uncharacterized protein n=1 Tax=Mycolicibacterium sphagni TaxID=1786 RepID=A0ABX2K078_9MYCO|nr:hypothetical protein [Mycolicibacterium sphagni]NTY63396.1 hypothetical protein [Mycolicibacterium sphagni]